MKCDDCGSTISGSFYETDGKTICKKDYEDVSDLHSKSYQYFYWQLTLQLYFQKYQKKCSVCDKPIEGTYFTKDEKIICDEDYRVCHFLNNFSK